ncbi:hypothetical protein NKH77_29810 [Streptomyces sp. M19]
MVGFAAIGGLLLAGCGTGDEGVRKEGPARSGWVSPGAAKDDTAVPSASPHRPARRSTRSRWSSGIRWSTAR